jgi:hypothetical protein
VSAQTGQASRALVLGGGGVTGSAWEVGVLAGLLEAGVDLRGAEDVVAMQEHWQALLLAPDEQSIAAIGPSIYDPARRRPTATAGRIQGVGVADAIAALWAAV